MKKLLICLSISLVAFQSYAIDFNYGECTIVVASRQTIREVKSYINENISDKRFLKVYKSENGWYAITIGELKKGEIEPILSKWKASGKIPQDSFCTRGTKFVQEVNLDTGTSRTVQRKSKPKPKKVSKPKPAPRSNRIETGDLVTIHTSGKNCDAIMITPGKTKSKVEFEEFCTVALFTGKSSGEKMWVPNYAITSRE